MSYGFAARSGATERSDDQILLPQATPHGLNRG